ncbi:hypothetical protein OG21DRAFT_1525020 [Imleria badia]|nr:hypothetical protein OG21DRAFT_1525020 [Imleria badia]
MPVDTVQAIINCYTMQLCPRATPAAAQKEASTEFRKSITSSSSFPKGKRTSRSISRAPNQEKPIKIGSVVMVPHGIDSTGKLREKKKPKKSELEIYHQYDFLISADGNKDLEFNISWSMVNIDSWFQRLFPKPFQWLDTRLGFPNIHWVLLNSQRQSHFALMQPTTTGKELDEVKGTSGHKFTLFTIAVIKALGRTELASDVMDIATTSDEPEEPEFKSDDNTIESFSTNNDADYSDPAAEPAQIRNDLKGKAKVKGKGKARAIDMGLASDSESDIQFLRAIGATVPSTANAFCIFKPGSGSTTTAHADETIPRLFADKAMDSVAKSDGDCDFSKTLVSQPESIQDLAPLAFPAATKVTVFKRHASTAFGTNMSQPSSGKWFKLDNYGAGMSSIPELEVSDSEVPQAGGSMLAQACTAFFDGLKSPTLCLVPASQPCPKPLGGVGHVLTPYVH